MRILHLIDPGSPGGGGCTLHMLAEPMRRLSSVHQDAVIIGSTRHAALAQRCGVDPAGVINPAINLPILARRPLRRLMRMFEEASQQYDLIHAWTPRSALLALAALPDRPVACTFPIGPITGFSTDMLGRYLKGRPVPLMVNSRNVLLEYSSLGFDASNMTILPPGVHPESVHMTPRAELRQRWELDGLLDDEETFVVGLLSEPLSWADVRTAANIASRIATTGRQIRLLVHPTASRRAEAEQWLRRLGLRDTVIVDDEIAEPWSVVQGLDAALHIGGDMDVRDLRGTTAASGILTGGGRRLRPMPGIMPLLWSMAAGVPVVTESCDAMRDIVDDGVTGMLVKPGDDNETAERLIRMIDDRSLGRRLGAHGLEAIHDRFHISGYCVRLKEAYERILDGKPLQEFDVEPDSQAAPEMEPASAP